MEVEKTEEELKLETLEVETLLVEEVETLLVEAEVMVEPKAELDPKQLASRQLAHEIKVANFLAGGKF